MSAAPEVLLKPGALSDLGERLRSLGAQRILLVTGPSGRFDDRLRPQLDGFAVTRFNGARVHVPEATVSEAREALRHAEADTLLTVGGGAATGLGKALRICEEGSSLRFVAVPTTYAGSEHTRLWGITGAAGKETGRDDRARPELIFLDPDLLAALPRHIAIKSLLNALAHPISSLSTGELPKDGVLYGRATGAIGELVAALEQLAADPAHAEARLNALRGSMHAAQILDEATLGEHHSVAHRLGGALDLEHAAVHAALLPQFLISLQGPQPETFEAICQAAGCPDLPATLFDVLMRAGAPTSLLALGVSANELRESLDPAPAWTLDALLGRRPSVRTRRENWGLGELVSLQGPDPKTARAVVVAVHGRGSTADAFLRRVAEITGDAPDVAVVAPQAADNEWYPKGYEQPIDEHGDALTAALATVESVITQLNDDGVPDDRLHLVGFSQGACLVLELTARLHRRFASVTALSGARIGPAEAQSKLDAEAIAGTPMLFGVSEADPWLQLGDVARSAEAFADAGAAVDRVDTTGDRHEITGRQRVRARELILGRDLRAGQRGFGGVHESEALKDALPTRQNSPRRPAYGLYAEQINGTGFVAKRGENQRAWMYRIRPSAQHRLFEPLRHATLAADFAGAPPEPNLCAWSPQAAPEQPRDFVDGLCTFGGAGSPELRRGFALHLYSADRSMEHRSFYNADGDLLIVPFDGEMTLLTELGVLDCAPGQIAIIPKGYKFSVLLAGATARGYVAEIFGRHFELPERGPVGANGLSDARHFRAPTAWFEDRLDPDYRLTAKFGGALFETTQDHSPYDVVAWHGEYTPYVYELHDFSPVSNVRFDHPDPSIYTVLSAPLDEQGANTLDFVVFPPRWDPTENTFRPPFFHRNVTTEFNGIVRQPESSGPFQVGMSFVTPAMTAHGVVDRGVERELAKSDADAHKAQRFGPQAIWFQFETALPIALSAWARNAPQRLREWPQIWGYYRTHYDPTQDTAPPKP